VVYYDSVISGAGSNSGWYMINNSKYGPGYVAADYVAPGWLIENPPFIIADNRALTDSEQAINAQYILNYMRSQFGWTKQAACGMIGNMEVESKMSPGAWQGFTTSTTTAKGYGIVQWTPSTKYFNWNIAEGYTDTCLEGQLHRIQYEVNNPSLQWSSGNKTPNMSFYNFTQSTQSASTLGGYFVACYEKPDSWLQGSASQKASIENTRGEKAAIWYNQLT
jgi:hypothetical protein